MGCSDSKSREPLAPGLDMNKNKTPPLGKQEYGYTEHTFNARWENTQQHLGSGGFSEVYLVKNRKSGKLAAAKIMHKRKMDDEDMKSVLDEVNIMRQLKHPNVVEFIDYFDEATEMYVVIEYCKGGTVFDRVIKKDHYSEKEARDLINIFLQTLKFCHERDIVHRDIKPENMLMVDENDDADVKLADFGLSIHLPNGELCMHACGTPNYIAPEMITKVGYSKPVDMWAVGCIAFILLGGYAPFDCEDSDPESMRALYRSIRKGQYTFDYDFDKVSDEAKHLIKGLLCVDVKKRLTVHQALDHPWVKRAGSELAARNLDQNLKTFKRFLAKRKFKGAVRGVIASNKFKNLIAGIRKGANTDKEMNAVREDVFGKDGENDEGATTPKLDTSANDVEIKGLE